MRVLLGLMTVKYTVRYCKHRGRNKWQ